MKERIFTAHELKVWNEHFGKYDMNEIIRLKRQYILANSHGLPKTSEEVEAIRSSPSHRWFRNILRKSFRCVSCSPSHRWFRNIKIYPLPIS